ncbi:Protein transport protein sec24 [Hondaea fermentalgiana]|uniref:Protein transport protein sec24 n=1 Tax=Hondaea fermentalgiana TaxID=2315210 RepID=A0A2R5GBT5_9STRA|nr:Protein transport protein sec24 [Hondaea fermentalgiana]|eukprot:GBG27168.1 Protein transport protein sec24 [Hondaea fermentalgiana]
MPRPKRNMMRQDIYTRQSLGQGKKLIPRCTDDFRAVDDGNANPKFMRMTLQQFPATGSLLNLSKIPLACAMQPFARLDEGEQEPMFVDLGEHGPTRCKRCRCYVNCFCPFDHSAGWWQCNLCKQQNALPPQYQGNYNSMYGSTAQPELAKGSVDFIVQGDYVSRPPQEPILLFAVDVSTVARQTGTCGAILRSIQKIVADHIAGTARIMGDDRARVGILTYAQGVHFYDMHTPSNNGHKVLIVADAEEGFCPLPPSRLVVNVDKNADELQALLEALVQEYGDPIPPVAGQQPGQGPPNASVAGTAFQAAVHGLELCGGKIAFFMTQPPTFGVGTTTTRKEDAQGYSTDRESGMYTVDVHREETVFTTTANRCCEKQISIDLYAFGDDHKDLANWGIASNLTGGEVQRFPLLAIDDSIGQATFQQVLEHNLRRNAALEAVLKVRASTGMRVVEYFGNGLKRTRGGELDMAFIDEDNTSLVVLEHDGTNVEAETEVYLQCAVLYTSVQGQRRVRVHNLAITVTNTIADVFRNADVDTISNFLTRKAVDQMQRNTPPAKVHSEMEQQIVKMLCSYRKNCAKNPTGQQLILPEALKLLPLYAIGAEKLPALRRNIEGLKSHRSHAQSALVRADARFENFNLLQRIPLRVYLDYIYPAMYSLQESDTPSTLPPKENAAPSLASFQDNDHGVVVLCNGIDVLLFLLPGTSNSLVELTTGHSSYSAALEATKQAPYADRGIKFVAQPGSHPFVEALEAFIRREVANPRASAASLLGGVRVYVRDGQHDRNTLRYLVEDSLFQLKSMPAYDDFLCTIHQSIQMQMRG